MLGFTCVSMIALLLLDPSSYALTWLVRSGSTRMNLAVCADWTMFEGRTVACYDTNFYFFLETKMHLRCKGYDQCLQLRAEKSDPKSTSHIIVSNNIHLHDNTTSRLQPHSPLNTVFVPFVAIQHGIRCQIYLSLVGDVAFHIKSRFGKHFGSCGHLIGGPGISEVLLRVTLNVFHGIYKEG